MDSLPLQTSEAPVPWGTKAFAALVLLGDLLVCVSFLAGGAWTGVRASFPYVWRDVAVVQILCAVPLAWVLAGFLTRRAPAGAQPANILAAVFLGVAILPLVGAVRESITPALPAGFPLSVVLRPAAALALMLSAALALTVLAGNRRSPSRRDGRGHTAAVMGLGASVLLLVPSIYLSARCQHDVARLGELLEQSRFGDARALVQGLLALPYPKGKWNGHPLPEVAEEIDRIVSELESRVAVPLGEASTVGERLERARELAMLGRTEAALDVLTSVPEPGAVADVDNLRGTICETRGEWEPAEAAYLRARTAWESRPSSPARAAGLLQATTGIAYCQRKSGRYAEAEANYQQVLALSPTADSYYLLAQFYEDTQQAEQARTHARQAMELDPARYGQKGEKLIRKLTVSDFGCLGVFTAENDRSGTSLFP